MTATSSSRISLGLIEGAHVGRRNWAQLFAPHPAHSRADPPAGRAGRRPVADFHQINSELALFDEKLGQKPQFVVFNKMDLPDAQERWPKIREQLKKLGHDPMAISAATHDHVREVINRTLALIDALPKEEPQQEPELPLYEMGEDPLAFNVTREAEGVFRVSGKRIERAAAMTYWDYDQALNRFQRILETMGIAKALEEAGIRQGDTVFIGDIELEWAD